MRTLVFNPADRNYELVYRSLMLSPLALRGSSERHLHGDVCGKLEGIGQAIPAVDGQGNPREYRRDELILFQCIGGGEVQVSDSEFDILKRHTTAYVDSEAFPKPWSREGSRCVEWLEQIQPDTEPAKTA